jgi:hypothetical protein
MSSESLELYPEWVTDEGALTDAEDGEDMEDREEIEDWEDVPMPD